MILPTFFDKFSSVEIKSFFCLELDLWRLFFIFITFLGSCCWWSLEQQLETHDEDSLILKLSLRLIILLIEHICGFSFLISSMNFPKSLSTSSCYWLFTFSASIFCMFKTFLKKHSFSKSCSLSSYPCIKLVLSELSRDSSTTV